jgi:hypothetical protein
MKWNVRTSHWLEMPENGDLSRVYARFSRVFIAFNAFYAEFGTTRMDGVNAVSWIDDPQFSISDEQLQALFQQNAVQFFVNRTPKDAKGNDYDAPILDMWHWLDTKRPAVPLLKNKDGVTITDANGKPVPKHYLIRPGYGGKPLSKEHLQQLVSVVHQVRNNLFHGGKDPSREDSVQVVQHATEVLEAVLKIALPQFDSRDKDS